MWENRHHYLLVHNLYIIHQHRVLDWRYCTGQENVSWTFSIIKPIQIKAFFDHIHCEIRHGRGFDSQPLLFGVLITDYTFKDLSLANALGNIFSPKHSFMSNIFNFGSWSNSIGRPFKDMHSEISRNFSCWSLQMEGGSIDKLGDVDNLNNLSDLNLPKSLGNFWKYIAELKENNRRRISTAP